MYNMNTILLILLCPMSSFDISDFNVPPVGNPGGIFIFKTRFSFFVESQIKSDFFLILTNFIVPLKT
jgi:hypothetical protein